MIPASWSRTFRRDGSAVALAGLLLVAFGPPSPGLDVPAAGAERSQVGGRPLAMDDLVAWCIVPFDTRKRTPEERIAMLERLGFKRYAYDWRTEHLPDTARELRLAREHGIRVEAVWMWIDGESDRPGQLGQDNERLLNALAEAGVSTQIWLGFAPSCFEGLSGGEKVARAVAMVRYLSDRAAETKSRVALYNHGDWFGEPENEIRILQSLPDREIGLVYNFHHGHEHIARFDALVKAMRPYLWVVNLNGMRPEGPKILPFGTGTHERRMLQAVLDSGFTGPFGVLGHVDADVEPILRGNLRGLGLEPK
ncbi:MAG TPA: AP endonuclease [Vicinamibacteria bacterium]|nr:AP endonuclease [Vicinamibacteria bacterium]